MKNGKLYGFGSHEPDHFESDRGIPRGLVERDAQRQRGYSLGGVGETIENVKGLGDSDTSGSALVLNQNSAKLALERLRATQARTASVLPSTTTLVLIGVGVLALFLLWRR